MSLKAIVTPDNRFIQLTEYTEGEFEQIQYSFKKRITNWRFHPLVKKKKYGMVTYHLWISIKEFL